MALTTVSKVPLKCLVVPLLLLYGLKTRSPGNDDMYKYREAKRTVSEFNTHLGECPKFQTCALGNV